MAFAPALCLQRRGGNISRRPIQPARQNRFWTERTRLACQNDENRLRDFLGQIGIAYLPQRRRMDEGDMAHDQCFKRRLGLAGGIFPQQCHVIIHHPTYTCTPGGK
jgi:hypothetical protein